MQERNEDCRKRRSGRGKQHRPITTFVILFSPYLIRKWFSQDGGIIGEMPYSIRSLVLGVTG